MGDQFFISSSLYCLLDKLDVLHALGRELLGRLVLALARGLAHLEAREWALGS